MARKACKVTNANAQNSWVDGLRQTKEMKDALHSPVDALALSDAHLLATWQAVKYRFAHDPRKKQDANARMHPLPGKRAARGGPSLKAPVELDFSSSDYWLTMKKVALAKFEQENLILGRAGRWHEPYADVMEKLEYSDIAAINYAMSIHRLDTSCEHDLDLLDGLCSGYIELVSCVIRPERNADEICLKVCNACVEHLQHLLAQGTTTQDWQ